MSGCGPNRSPERDGTLGIAWWTAWSSDARNGESPAVGRALGSLSGWVLLAATIVDLDAVAAAIDDQDAAVLVDLNRGWAPEALLPIHPDGRAKAYMFCIVGLYGRRRKAVPGFNC